MTSRKCILAAVAGALSLTAASARADEAQDARIQELENKIAALEAKQAQSSADLAAAMDAVLRDAENRSRLFATSGESGAGYDNGFFIRTGDFLLRPSAQFQFRYVTNFREDAQSDRDDDWEDGFEVRRMKFALAGTAFKKEFKYKFQWQSEREGGDLLLEEAWAEYMFSPDWGLRAGQFKSPAVHEEITSSKYQMAVDRSMLNELLGGGYTDYTQGVSLLYGNYAKDNPLAIEVAFTDGPNQENTRYYDSEATFDLIKGVDKYESDFGVAGRIDYKIMGDWKSYQDFSAMKNKDTLWVVGGGFDWAQTGDGNALLGTVDTQFETAGGLGLYGAFLIRNMDEDAWGGDDDATDYGFLVQGNYMLDPSFELFARYDVTWFDNEVLFAGGGSEDTFHEITVGINYYMFDAGHRAKFTLDITYLPNGAPGSISGLGIMGGNEGEDEWMLRGQFQLLI